MRIIASLSPEEALRDGVLEAADSAALGATVRIVPLEDDGTSLGPVRVKSGAVVRDGVILCSGCTVGERSLIGHHTVLRAGVTIGSDCVVSHGVCIERGATIGDRVRVSSLTHITGGCLIEDEVQIGARVVTINMNELRWVEKREKGRAVEPSAPPIFRRRCRVGSGATLLAGVEIGSGSLVGAGAVVTRSVPPGVVAYGVPAYVQREL